MENVKEMTMVKNLKKMIVDNCMNCGSDELVPIKNFKHEFDGVEMTHDVVSCSKCKSFHYIEDGSLTYEYIYKDMFAKTDEVKWTINEN